MPLFSRRLAVALLGLSSWTAPAVAASLPGGFERLLVFGDSLSDTGNILDATGFFPPPPYNDGRFTGGLTHVDLLAQTYGLAPGADLFNFAFGGAKAQTDLTDAIPDFGEQIGLFQLSGPLPPAKTVALAGFGGNDAFAAAEAAANAFPLDDAQARDAAMAAGAAAADAFAVGVQALGALGVDAVAALTLPDPGRTPRFNGGDPSVRSVAVVNVDSGAGVTEVTVSLSPLVTAAAEGYNVRLAQPLDGLRAAGSTIVEVDIATRFAAVLDDPAAFGFTETSRGCGTFAAVIGGLSFYDFSDDLCIEAPGALNTEGVAYWDDLHPNQPLHAEIARQTAAALETTLAPVPLPAPAAMLAGALGVLGAAAFRAGRTGTA
jgi:outer membrane lipase/esterase